MAPRSAFNLGALARSPLIGAALAPFLATRLLLLLVGWFVRPWPLNPAYPADFAVGRGWHFSPNLWLDMWARWDSGWYLSIVRWGYTLKGDFREVQTTVAFYPLYPFLIRGVAALLPPDWRADDAFILIGVVLSNLLLLVAVGLLYLLVRDTLKDEDVARRAVWYSLIFPASLFYSAVYTEATFLCLSVATFYAATRRAWLLVGILGALASVTRSVGVLLALPMAWLYLESVGWRPQRLGWQWLWLALIPAGLALFGLSLTPLTGTPLAPLMAHAPWGRGLTWPWYALLHPGFSYRFITPVDYAVTVGFLILALLALVWLPSRAYGLYALALLAPILLSGTLLSATRAVVVAFPVFIVLARLGRRRWVDLLITTLSLGLLTLFMAAWTRMYWVG